MLQNLTQPTLLLNQQVCQANIAAMQKKAKQHGLTLVPHVKTHQSHTVGQWQGPPASAGITVSSVAMAQYFAQAGWQHITIAFPVNIRAIEAINALAAKVQLSLLVVNTASIQALNSQVAHPVQLFIEVDAGYARTGVPNHDLAAMQVLLDAIQQGPHKFAGFYLHAGHSYNTRGSAQIEALHQESLNALRGLKQHFINSYPNLKLALGDTPSCSVSNDFEDIDQIHPGNYVFYDLMQTQIGSCTTQQIAVALACPVVAVQPHLKQIVVHGGATHLAKDVIQENGHAVYGKIVSLTANGWTTLWPDMYIKKLSQEHGLVHCSTPQALARFKEGDLLGVLPVHSCHTAQAMRGYVDFAGRAIDHMQGQPK